mgnify:CR=1 FL=1
MQQTLNVQRPRGRGSALCRSHILTFFGAGREHQPGAAADQTQRGHPHSETQQPEGALPLMGRSEDGPETQTSTDEEYGHSAESTPSEIHTFMIPAEVPVSVARSTPIFDTRPDRAILTEAKAAGAGVTAGTGKRYCTIASWEH